MPRPESGPPFEERYRVTPGVVVQRGTIASGFMMAGTVLAMAATLLLLLAGKLGLQILAGGRWLLERSPLWPAIARRPFAFGLAASIGGATATLATGTGTRSFLFAAAAAGLACLLLAAAAPLVLRAAAEPDTSPTISRRLRAFHARAGRNRLDAGWSEVVLGAALLIVPPLLAALADPRATPLALLIYATAIWATRTSLVDFEHGDAHYAFFRPNPDAGRAERRGLAALRWFAQQPLALVSGRIPYWYAVQHVAVHHAENNGLADTQSTVPYDRASFGGFAVCAQRFALSGLLPLDVLRYLIARRRMKPLRHLCGGYGLYLAWLGLLFALDPRVALALIAVRYVSLLADAAGFFQEHGLISPDEPENIITGALHYINNNIHGSRGEDLHIEHHFRPGLHWSEYLATFSSRRTDYARHRAIGFPDGPGRLRFYYRCLWRRDFAELARHVEVFGGDSMSELEIARLLEARTAPAGPRPWPSLPAWIERSIGRFAARVV